MVSTEEQIPEQARSVLDYWFGDGPATTVTGLETKLNRWFGNDLVARDIRERFASLVHTAESGGLEDWAKTRLGTLALVIVLDQFLRSYYGMDDRRAFSQGQRAVKLAVSLLEAGIPSEWTAEHHFFVLIPLGHAENLDLHKQALEETWILVDRAPLHLRPMFETIAAQLLRFMSVIERFGRYPHRNAALGRESTPEEIEFLRRWKVRHPAQSYAEQIEAGRRMERELDSADTKKKP